MLAEQPGQGKPPGCSSCSGAEGPGDRYGEVGSCLPGTLHRNLRDFGWDERLGILLCLQLERKFMGSSPQIQSPASAFDVIFKRLSCSG